MAACLHFFCGKAGAGKSTLADELSRSENAMLVSEDVWLARLYGDQMQTFDDYIRCSLRLRTVVGPLLVDVLRSGRNAVFDFPANTQARRAWCLGVVREAGATHLVHFVDTPDETCMERIALRNAARPEGSHHLTREQFAFISSLFEAPAADEGLAIRKY